MFASSSDVKDSDGNALVTSYAVHRPDGEWSMMVVNRDENNQHGIRVAFSDAKAKRDATFEGPVTLTTFGSDQYVWINAGRNSHADPDGPPVASMLTANSQTMFTQPKPRLRCCEAGYRC